MNRRITKLTATLALLTIPVIGFSQTSLTNATPSNTQNFDAMGASLTLPTNWRISASNSSPTWNGAATAVTQQASTSSPATGGTYNFGTSTSERAVGAMTSGGFGSPNSLIGFYTNGGTTNITDLTVAFDAERYRVNTAAASVQLYYSLNGTSWTAVAAGDIATTSFPTGASAYSLASPLVVPKTGVTISGLNIAPNANFYLRWNINTTGGNSQGIAIDNIAVAATFVTATVAPEINIIQGTTNYLTNATYAFGNAVVGATATPVTFTVQNTGNANLTVSDIQSNSADFVVSATPTFPATVAAAGTTTYEVSFNPSSTGAKTGIITITNDDADEASYVINVSGTGTNSSSSNIIANSAFVYSQNVDYTQFIQTTATNTNAQAAFGLTLQDGGNTLTDADALPTELSAFNLTYTGAANTIQAAALYNGSTLVANGTVGANNIAFTGLTGVSAPDNGSANLTLYITYNTTVTDKQQLQFAVNAATAGAIATSSQFATSDAGAAQSSIASDNNRIAVTASRLEFGIQPSNVSTNTPINPAVTFIAKDVNGNKDVDFTGAVSVTSNGLGFAPTATTSANAIAGIATFSNLLYTTAGTGVTLTGSSSLGTTANSTAFNITVPASTPPGLLLLEDNFEYATGDVVGKGGWNVHGAGASNTIKVTASNLSYTGYPSTTGNAITITPSGEDDNEPFTSQASGTVFTSFLVNVSVANAGDYFLHLGSSTMSTSQFASRVFAKSSGGGVSFGISSGSNTANYAAAVFPLNQTHLIVVKSVISGTTVTSSMYIDPASLAVEPSTADATGGSTDFASFFSNLGAVAVRQGNSAAPTAIIDGIRVATGYGAATGYINSDVNQTIAAGNYYNVNATANTLTATGNINVVNQLNLNGGMLSAGVNTVSTAATATVTGGSAASYIAGKLTRNTASTTPVIFPVGKAGKYAPVVITPNGSNPSTYSVEFNTAFLGTPNYQTVNSPLQRVDASSYFNIDRVAGGEAADITLPYSAANNNVSSYTSLVVAHNNGSSWDALTSTAPVGDAVSGTVTATGVSTFSPFTLGATTVQPLPVKLASFTLQKETAKATLNWTLQTTDGGEKATLERSNDGKSFTALNTQSIEKAMTVKQSYTDAAPVSGVNYYRLAVTGTNGAVNYSNILAALFARENTVNIYPNPARQFIQFDWTNSTLPVMIEVRNLTGTLVSSQTVNGTTHHDLSVAGIANGAYIITWKQGETMKHQQIQVMH